MLPEAVDARRQPRPPSIYELFLPQIDTVNLGKTIKGEVDDFVSREFKITPTKLARRVIDIFSGNRKPLLMEAKPGDQQPDLDVPENIQNFYSKIDNLAKIPFADTKTSIEEKACHARFVHVFAAAELLKSTRRFSDKSRERQTLKLIAEQIVLEGANLSRKIKNETDEVSPEILQKILDHIRNPFNPYLGEIEIILFTKNSVPQIPKR